MQISLGVPLRIVSVAPSSRNAAKATMVPPASPYTMLFGTQFL
jgi:hypothetical protein